MSQIGDQIAGGDFCERAIAIIMIKRIGSIIDAIADIQIKISIIVVITPTPTSRSFNIGDNGTLSNFSEIPLTVIAIEEVCL